MVGDRGVELVEAGGEVRGSFAAAGFSRGDEVGDELADFTVGEDGAEDCATVLDGQLGGDGREAHDGGGGEFGGCFWFHFESVGDKGTGGWDEGEGGGETWVGLCALSLRGALALARCPWGWGMDAVAFTVVVAVAAAVVLESLHGAGLMGDGSQGYQHLNAGPKQPGKVSPLPLPAREGEQGKCLPTKDAHQCWRFKLHRTPTAFCPGQGSTSRHDWKRNCVYCHHERPRCVVINRPLPYICGHKIMQD